MVVHIHLENLLEFKVVFGSTFRICNRLVVDRGAIRCGITFADGCIHAERGRCLGNCPCLGALQVEVRLYLVHIVFKVR